MPTTPELQRAYTDLFIAANGSKEDRIRIGDPSLLPRPWDPPSCTTRALRGELWDWLEAVVSWFNHEYVWDMTAGMIPPCWPHHPHLVHEIAVLADQRRRSSIDTTSASLEDWHRHATPAFLERMKARMKNGCDDRHQTWPAEARFARGAASGIRADRAAMFSADIADLTTAPETVEPNRPRLHLIDGESGRPIDPVTGEIL